MEKIDIDNVDTSLVQVKTKIINAFYAETLQRVFEKIIAETDKEEKHYNKLAAGAREHVDERLMLSYDRIRKNYRNGLAVVPVERDACGGCFNAIPPQKQSDIKQRKKIITFRNIENCAIITETIDIHYLILLRSSTIN